MTGSAWQRDALRGESSAWGLGVAESWRIAARLSTDGIDADVPQAVTPSWATGRRSVLSAMS
jgi:hypothetical protein